MKKKLTLIITLVIACFCLSGTKLYSQIDFKQNVTQGCAPLTVKFTYTGTNPKVKRIDWNFYDGSPTVSTTLPINTVTHTFTKAGHYDPYIFVYDVNSVYLEQTYSSLGGIDVIGAPTINSSDSVCINEKASFQANGKITSVSWAFGDGGTSTDEYPQHAYPTLGTYTITLTSNTICGNFISTKRIYVTNKLKPLPFISSNINGAICPNFPVNFGTNTFATYSWNFGDGNTSNKQSPTHAYTTVGTRTITLTVTNTCGKSGSATATVTVAKGLGFPSGTSIGSYSPAYCPGEEAAGYVNGGSNYPRYVWNYGDGSLLDSVSGSYYRHKFFALGTYTVSCKITNHCGKDSTFYNTVKIINNKAFPTSQFALDVTTSPSCPNSSVSFRAPSGNYNYEWNFGDATPLTTTTSGYTDHTFGSTLKTYTVSVKVTNLCGKDTTLYSTVIIKNPAAFPNNSNFSLSTYSSPACPNSSISFYAPYGYNSYKWDFGDGTPLVSSSNSSYSHIYGSTITTYTASVKISNTCGNDTILYSKVKIVSNLPFPTSGFELRGPENAICPGDQMNWSAPSNYTTYKWVFGDGNSTISSNGYINHHYLTAGVYTTSVTITNACGKDTTISANVTVSSSGKFPSGLSLNVSPSVVCPNDIVNLSLNNQTFSSYFWNFGDGNTLTTTGESIQHSYSSTGTYSVSCKVKNGCGNFATINQSVKVINNAPINSDLSMSGLQNPSCAGDKVFFIMDNGGTNYKYTWNYGDGSPIDTTVGGGSNHIFKTNGTYTVSAIVTNGCGVTKKLTATQVVASGQIPTLVDERGGKSWGYPNQDDNAVISSAGCANDAIVFYFMGSAANNHWDFGDGNTGTATESMLIYGGDGAFPVTIIKYSYAVNGIYKVKLTLTNGCGNSVTDSMTISIGGNKELDGDLTTSPPPYTTCASIDFLAFGGATYGWNFGDGSPVLNTTSPTVSHTFSSKGVYAVSVLITNGCGNSDSYSRSVNVNGVGGPAIALSSLANPTCINYNNGSAVVSATSGQPPYIYSWNDAKAQTTAIATGLSAGMYNVTVVDNIGCKSVIAVSITNPAAIVLQTPTTTTSCGGATGAASVNVSSGGTNPFSYQWSSGATGAIIAGLSAGIYSVTATDFKGCTSFANVGISENGGPTLSINAVTGVTNVSCNGSLSGAINLNVSGAVPPYKFLWSNGATTEDPSGLSAGNYSVQVKDNAGCKSTINTTITQPNPIAANASVSKPPTCGNFDGKAVTSASGGISPYTYLWDSNTGNQATQTATGLPAGTYNVTITDAKGCTKEGVVSLSNSNAPNINANTTDISCNGGSNGAIDLTVTGGTAPYLYTWTVGSPQTNNQDLTGLASGSYLVLVQDSKNCLTVRNFMLAQPAALSASVKTTNATCRNIDGTALASATGGNIPYSYSWTNGQTKQTATGLSTGNYTVIITDNKGCTANATTSIAVSAPTPTICMVTVDSASINNIIYWDKTSYSHIDSFIVYREVSTNIYKRIGAVKDTAFTKFIDTARSVGLANGDPNIGTYRYKIQLLDSCGNYSVLSPYHNTVYVDVNTATGVFTWNQYIVEGMTNPLVSNNNLMCDTTTGWWAIGSVAGAQTTLIDSKYSSRSKNTKWRVEADGLNCTPTRAGINTTRSNIKHSSATIGVNEINPTKNYLEIYPNPANETLTVQYSGGHSKYQLQIFDALGQLVYNESLSTDGSYNGIITKQMDVSSFRKGIYILSVKTESNSSFKRLVIQ